MHTVIQLFQQALATLQLDESVSYQLHLVAKNHLDMLLAKLLLRLPTLENCMLHARAGYHVHLNEMRPLEKMAPICIFGKKKRM